MKKGVIFDLDGTLWDSAEGVCKAWNIVLKDNGLQKTIDVDCMHSMMGKQMDEIAVLLFPEQPEQRRRELMAACCQIEQEILAREGGKLYEGTEKVLNELHGKYMLGIVSNCQCGYIETFIKAHGMGEYFTDTECFGNTGKSKGQNIVLIKKRNSLDKAVYIGDTLGDCMSAKYSHTPFVHAAYGFGRVDEAKYSVSDIRRLPDVLEKILS